MSDFDATPKRKVGRRKAEAVDIVAPALAPVPTAAPVEPAAPLMLKSDEISKMKIFEAEARAARAEAEVARIRKKYFLALLDPKGTVEAEEKRQAGHMETAREWAKKHELLIAHISMRLGVDLKECAFDPDTGVVVIPEKSAQGKK